MNIEIKKAIEQGRLVLFLGAGASCSSKTKRGQNLPSGYALAVELARKMDLEYNNEPLNSVYNAAKRRLGDGLIEILEENFKHCTPSEEYNTIASIPFARVYTLNIDDALEKALLIHSEQNVNIRRRNDKRSERDLTLEHMDLIKLNGDIKNPSDGFIFSAQEYGAASATPPIWYEEVANDFYNFTFLFIGTKLNEPLLQHHIQRYKDRTNSLERRSFLIVPSATPIEEDNLSEQNITFIQGTIESFSEWLKKEFNKKITWRDIFLNSRPEFNVKGITDEEKYIAAYNQITVVSAPTLSLLKHEESSSKIKSFYKGYKPSWKDIMDDIPATLSNTQKSLDICIGIYNGSSKERALFIFGAAGSGKSTLLKQVALNLNRSTGAPVYYTDNMNSNIKEIAYQLNKSVREKFFIFVEKVADHAEDIGDILKNENLKNCIIVGTESKAIWSHRGKEYLYDSSYCEIDISHINESDAGLILKKIEQHGNWTRLVKMTPAKRTDELIKKSKKQLLIGLLEATLGEGYLKIIGKEYESIPSDSHKALLVLTGISSLQRAKANETTLTRALRNLNCDADVHKLVREMDGILDYKNGEVESRHFTYINTIFDNFIDLVKSKEYICAYIEAFLVYEHPIIHNVSKSEAAIYKSLTNAKFLRKILKNNIEHVLSVYERFEKDLEHEGLFLLQYGLALRSFQMHDEAFNKIKLANVAYSESAQIEHALAQQMLIISNEIKTPESKALTLLEEAKKILETLDMSQQKELFDAYPMVTLSEGHVKIIDRVQGNEEAKKIARHYYEIISKRNRERKQNNQRLQESSQMLFTFATTGKFPKGQR